jgi:hypothetical protein
MMRHQRRPSGPALLPRCPRCRRAALELIQPSTRRPLFIFAVCLCGSIWSAHPSSMGPRWAIGDPVPVG